MNGKRQKHPRRIKLINRDFQIGLMVKLTAVNVAILGAFVAVLYWFLRGEVDANLRSAHVSYRTMGDMLFPIVVTLGLLMVVLLAISIVFVILYASHRIAGPLFRFNQALVELGNRKLTAATQIRQDDQLAEVSASLSRVRDVWAEDIRELRQALATAESEEVEQGLGKAVSAVVNRYEV